MERINFFGYIVDLDKVCMVSPIFIENELGRQYWVSYFTFDGGHTSRLILLEYSISRYGIDTEYKNTIDRQANDIKSNFNSWRESFLL